MSNCKDVFHQEVGITCQHFGENINLKIDIKKLEAENKELKDCLEFVVNNSGTSSDYNLRSRLLLEKIKQENEE